MDNKKEVLDEGQQEDYACIWVEQYVSEVLDFSSQYGAENSISYTAHNIVGMPSVFPAYGDYTQTFVMRDYGPWWHDSPSGRSWLTPILAQGPKSESIGNEASLRGNNFLDVKFEHAVYPIQVNIYETFHPGSVVAIWAGNCKGSWRLLWDSNSSANHNNGLSQRPRIFSPPLQQTNIPVKQLRLEFNQTNLAYYTEIDAIALLGTLYPVSAEAKATALLPDRPGPILDRIVKSGLHILQIESAHEILDNCLSQLNQHAIQEFMLELENRENKPAVSHLGAFECLPREIILKIFHHLDVISLSRMSQTCTKLLELSLDPFLYTCLDLRQIFSTVSSHTLRWLQLRCGSLSRLDLSWCGNYGKIQPNVLQEFFETCGQSLLELRLNSCHVATGSVLESIAATCAQLHHLSLASCHLLKMSDFNVIAYFENLVSVNLYRTTVGQTTIISILCNNPRIRHLGLGACPNIDGDEICIILSHCQSGWLESLDLWRCNSLTDRGMAHLTVCSRLLDLDIGWCLNVHANTGSLVRLIEGCPRLKRLYLTAHRETSDRDVRELGKLEDLEQLDLLGNRDITLSAVDDLLSCASSLRLLDISYCSHLGESAIHTLRQKYPHVSIKWSLNPDT